MSSNWANNLDMLAQNGVISFDAPSFVMGQKPRYVGNPAMIPGLDTPLPEAPLLMPTQKDEFKQAKPQTPDDITNDAMPKNNNLVKNPNWKKILFGAIALGGLVLGGVKFKSTIMPWFKNGCGLKNVFKGKSSGTSKKGFMKTTSDFLKKTGKAIKDFFVKGWNKFTGIFKSKKKP